MSYEFKKLSEVEALTEVPEGAKVLAEANGKVVRVPGSGLGGSALVVTVIINAETGEISVNTEFETVKAKVLAGEQVVLNYFQEVDGTKYFYCRSISATIVNNDTLSFTCCSTRTYDINGIKYPRTNIGAVIWTSDGKFVIKTSESFFGSVYVLNQGGFFLTSSTPGSNKLFRISVDDSGALTATEVTN